MNPINTPATRMGVSTPTADPPGTSQTASTIPATHFSHYPVLGDGDCLFRAMLMGLLNQPGLEPSEEQVMGLRQYLANYVYQNQNALIGNPAFEGRQGVLNLYDLLLTPGQWNHNAGDLVAPLLAQVSGRPLAVLQPADEGTAYHVRQVFPADNPLLPPGSFHNGEATICLAHISGNHYGYLEERYPNVLLNAFNQAQATSQPAQNIPFEPQYPDVLSNTFNQAQVASQAGQNVPLEPQFAPLDKQDSRSQKRIRSNLNDAQKNDLLQFCLAHPSWGANKLAREFMNNNPGAAISKRQVYRLKSEHQVLLGVDVDSMAQGRVSSDSREAAIAQLWWKNPKWGHRKMMNEFNKHNPEQKVTLDLVRAVKEWHPSLQGLTLGTHNKRKKLNSTQEWDVAQLWRQNPQWSYLKVAGEFNKHNPDLKVSAQSIRNLKDKHPGLWKAKLGSHKKEKSLSKEQEKGVIKLWLAKPSWGERKIAKEYMRLNPGVRASRGIVHSLKDRYPELKTRGLGSSMQKRRFSFSQERDALKLWRANPQWSESQFIREYSQRNPGTEMTKGTADNLRLKNPDLGGAHDKPPRTANQNFSKAHRHALIELCLEKPDWGAVKIAREFNTRNTDVTVSRSFTYRLKKYLDLTGKSMAQQGFTGNMTAPPDVNNVVNSETIAEEETRSQGTFAALSDIADIDNLFSGLDDISIGNSSQGTFAGLEDFEEVSRLKDD